MRLPTSQRFNRLKELQIRLGCKLPAIEKAAASTERDLVELEQLLLPQDRPLAENVSLIFCGSIARGESTSGSDLDWTLLINGEVDGQHFHLSQEIRRQLVEAKKTKHGATGIFGGLAFSHDLVHYIGGQDDTNRNLSLRMLLLLESLSVGDDEPRQMVIRAILNRYLTDDPHWTQKPGGKLPRFLLNDVVRFWRTMAVDFADKFHDQAGEKWALRNAKLRFSRKLIFLTGMLGCFSWRLHKSNIKLTLDNAPLHFERYFSRPPLEILADELMLTNAPHDLCRKIFSAYDKFLEILDNEASRNTLCQIPRERADKDAVFQDITKHSHEYRDALLEWLYSPPLFDLVKEYALF
jgi:predicted nucleotidyltransferase